MGRKALVDPRKEVFAHLIALEGRTVKDASKDERVAISYSQATRWFKEPEVQALIREGLDAVRLQARQLAARELEKTIKKVVAAQDDPTVTPTMFNAMRFTLQLAGATIEDKAQEEKGTSITVQVNTAFGADLIAAQQQRQQEMSGRQQQDEEAIDADFEVRG